MLGLDERLEHSWVCLCRQLGFAPGPVEVGGLLLFHRVVLRVPCVSANLASSGLTSPVETGFSASLKWPRMALAEGGVESPTQHVLPCDVGRAVMGRHRDLFIKAPVP